MTGEQAMDRIEELEAKLTNLKDLLSCATDDGYVLYLSCKVEQLEEEYERLLYDY